MERSARECRIPVGSARLHSREIGSGPPLIVLHGGPDFDSGYLLPDLDRLSASLRVVTYDQRGRGRSAAGVPPADVTMDSEIADLDAVREHFRLESAAILGHSWGALLAMEYAIRHPDRVSHLIVANTAPVSHEDYRLLRQELGDRRPAADVERMEALSSSVAFAEGDPETVAEYYRIHFRIGLRRPEHVATIVDRLRAGFTNEGILEARAIEDRLREQTWLSSDYDLFPGLRRLAIPTLVIHGRHDLIPVACAVHVAETIRGARFVVVPDCGHFSFLESPEIFDREVAALIRGG